MPEPDYLEVALYLMHLYRPHVDSKRSDCMPDMVALYLSRSSGRDARRLFGGTGTFAWKENKF